MKTAKIIIMMLATTWISTHPYKQKQGPPPAATRKEGESTQSRDTPHSKTVSREEGAAKAPPGPRSQLSNQSHDSPHTRTLSNKENTAEVPPSSRSQLSNQTTREGAGAQESVSGQPSRGQHLPSPPAAREPSKDPHEADHTTGKHQGTPSSPHNPEMDDQDNQDIPLDDPAQVAREAMIGIHEAQVDLVRMQKPWLLSLGLTEKPKVKRGTAGHPGKHYLQEEKATAGCMLRNQLSKLTNSYNEVETYRNAITTGNKT